MRGREPTDAEWQAYADDYERIAELERPHNAKRCQLPCHVQPNPDTICGHWWCPHDHCTALDEYTSVDYTTPGFTHPEENT